MLSTDISTAQPAMAATETWRRSALASGLSDRNTPCGSVFLFGRNDHLILVLARDVDDLHKRVDRNLLSQRNEMKGFSSSGSSAYLA